MDNPNPKGHRKRACFSDQKRSAPFVGKSQATRPNWGRRVDPYLSNAKYARAMWGAIPGIALGILADLTKRHGLSVAAGDLQLLDGRWYVTHAGLLGIAHRSRCFGIRTALQKDLSDAAANRWVFRATVYETPSSRGFVGYGDADPSNVSPVVRGAEMRVALGNQSRA